MRELRLKLRRKLLSGPSTDRDLGPSPSSRRDQIISFGDDFEDVKQSRLKLDTHLRDTTNEWTALRNGNREMVQLLLSSKTDAKCNVGEASGCGTPANVVRTMDFGIKQEP
jgi:hypothetical protein